MNGKRYEWVKIGQLHRKLMVDIVKELIAKEEKEKKLSQLEKPERN